MQVKMKREIDTLRIAVPKNYAIDPRYNIQITIKMIYLPNYPTLSNRFYVRRNSIQTSTLTNFHQLLVLI